MARIIEPRKQTSWEADAGPLIRRSAVLSSCFRARGNGSYLLPPGMEDKILMIAFNR
jgi:hypothetical protein